MNSLKPIIEALEQAHGYFNRELFKSRLSDNVVVTVQTRGRKSAYGWYGHGFWANGEATPSEMNLSAEDLKRDPQDVILTLVHEMVHQAAAEAGIKDTSRNGRYHNRAFAKVAREAGLLAPDKPDKRHGFSNVTLGPSEFRARKAFDSIDSKVLDVFQIARRVFPARASKSRMRLYICQCEPPVKIRSGRKDLLVQCLHCMERFFEPEV